MNEDFSKTPAKRITPQSELDLNMMITNPTWGNDDLHPEAMKGLSEHYHKVYHDEKGKIVKTEEVTENSLWRKLGFFTRDFRLGFLSKEDMPRLTWWTETASICSLHDFKNSTMTCLAFVTPSLELSQSRSGNLRKQMSTLISEQSTTLREPDKRRFSIGNKQ